MSDHRFDPRTDDAALSAYLAGDLDEADAEVLEERLRTDPALAGRLDALAETVAELAGLEDIEPPAGFTDRLRDRVHAEAPDETVVPLTRPRSTGRWRPAAVAAAVVVVAAGAGLTLTNLGVGDDLAAPEIAQDEADVAEEAAPEAEDAPAEATDGAVARADVPSEPTVRDEQASLADDEAVRERYVDAPEVVGLLGVDRQEADDLATAFAAALERVESFDSIDTDPAACLDVVRTDAGGPLVPALIETVVLDGRSALSYVLIGARGEDAVLDRVEAWVVDPQDCATLLFTTVR